VDGASAKPQAAAACGLAPTQRGSTLILGGKTWDPWWQDLVPGEYPLVLDDVESLSGLLNLCARSPLVENRFDFLDFVAAYNRERDRISGLIVGDALG